MKTILAIDIGNTNITTGIFKGGSLAGKARISTNLYSSYAAGFKNIIANCDLKKDAIDEVVISSVVPLALARLMVQLNKMALCGIKIIGKDVKVPIANNYRRKYEVGQDRLVGAFAAKMLYGAPCVVIDLGTAITFDIVSRKGEYLGGLILPGIEMSFSGLYTRTALLPKVELKPTAGIIGKDTVNSMRGGMLYGFGSMCDGLAAKYRKMLGKDTRIIATGGNAGLIRKYARAIQVVDNDLVLKGLQLISE